MNQYTGPYYPKNMQKIYQCTFGQKYDTAIAYNYPHAEIVHGNAANITGYKPHVEIKVTSKSLTNEMDYEGFCGLFEISQHTLLNTFANCKTSIDEIWNFLFDNVKGLCYCISVFIVDCSSQLIDQRTLIHDERQILEFYTGQHFLIIIPIEKFFPQYNIDIETIIKNKHKSFPDFLEKPGTILVNYNERESCTNVYQYLIDLHKKAAEKDLICTTMAIQKHVDQNPTDIHYKNEFLTILAGKKLGNIVKSKFPSEAIYENDKKFLSTGIDQIESFSEHLRNRVDELIKDLISSHPPRLINSIYWDLRFFQDSYLRLIYQNSTKLPFNKGLYDCLIIACNELAACHYVKEDDYWILKLNERNVDEINSIVAGKYRVCFNQKIKEQIKEFYDERNEYRWIISTRKIAKSLNEPMFYLPDDKWYYLGMVYGSLKPEDAQKTKIYVEFCDCKIGKKDKRVWMCNACKTVLFEAKENPKWVICNCSGIYLQEELIKKCVNCKDVDNIKNETQNVSQKKENGVTPHENDAKIKPNSNPKNIIFIGQTGAGKSTLINSIANYVEYDFEQACKNPLKCYLPCQFQLQTPKFDSVIIKDGPLNENEDFNNAGESVTQKPKLYHIETSQYTFNIIDTPGLGDSRGAKQDSINVEYIRKVVHECGKIDAICFVIPSNITKLTANFEVLMRDLLSIFPKTALKNVAFFFTYANSTFFAIGETRKPIDAFIKNFQKTNNASIPFGPENVFCVDSEAFMYFIATKQGHKYQHRTEESFGVSWTKSKEAITKFLAALENVEAIKSSDIQEIYDLEQIVKDVMEEKDFKSDLQQELTYFLKKAIAHSSMTQFASSFKSSKPMSKEKIPEALDLVLKAVKTISLKDKIADFLNKYYGMKIEWRKYEWISSVKKDLKIIVELLANLYENKKLNQNYVEDLFSIYHAYAIKEKIPENLDNALNTFLEYAKTSNKKELEQKINNLLVRLSEDQTSGDTIVEKL